ncbi:hypothetical protein INS49_012242 [Diaporthe citri]|uniref:uncharacterized protein n=1 Tax=Diaporthe citri TaxID=83186 RepID=UPI001C819E1E|nr:uncharacterized protein INS49_012242 [Diaporthe citri]KAG6358723.1 hypothetical protein INS49_012242 [Diaporthe citri]
MKEQLQRLELSPTDLLVPRRPPGLRSSTPTYLDPAVFSRFFVGDGPQSAHPHDLHRTPRLKTMENVRLACSLSCYTTLTTSQDVDSDALAPAPFNAIHPRPSFTPFLGARSTRYGNWLCRAPSPS